MVVTVAQAQAALHADMGYFPSPEDWRDHLIYFLMIDRFNNPAAPPQKQWDAACATYISRKAITGTEPRTF